MTTLQICSLRAENLEKDKDYRQKLQTMQQNHNEQVEHLKVRLVHLVRAYHAKRAYKQRLFGPVRRIHDSWDNTVALTSRSSPED